VNASSRLTFFLALFGNKLDSLTFYLDAGAGKFDAGCRVAIIGPLNLDGFPDEEKSRPLAKLEEIPLEPFHSGRAQAPPR
jgi:hypothetical protein